MSNFSKTILTDSLGNNAEIGLFGALKVTEPNAQISSVFNSAIEDRDFIQVNTGGGYLTPRFNRSILKVGTIGTGSASMTTTKRLRYRAGATVEANFTCSWTGDYTVANAADTALVGLYDDSDGVYMGYQGTTFVVGYRNKYADNGVGNEPDVTAIIPVTWDTTKIHRYRIRFAFLGVGNISYEYFDGRSWVLLHTFQTDGTLIDRTHLGAVILPMRISISTIAANTVYMSTGSWSASTYSKDNYLQDHPHYVDFKGTIAPGATEKGIVAFRNNTTFLGFPNQVSAQLLFAEFATASEGLYRVNIYAYPPNGIAVDIPAVSYTDLYPNISPFQIDDTNVPNTSVTPTGQKVFGAFLAVPSSGVGVSHTLSDFSKLDMKAYTGDEFLLTLEEVKSGAGTNIFAMSLIYADLG